MQKDKLIDLAVESMVERDLLPEFPEKVEQELFLLNSPAQPDSPLIRDMRDRLWASIDNDETKDLDQLTYAEKLLESEAYKIYIAIADVETLVKKDSAIDRYAQYNTTSVYTPFKNFPMLPRKLSNDLTSLNENEDRLALIVEIKVDQQGSLIESVIYRGYVHNYAKLSYNAVSDWLDQRGPMPPLIEKIPDLDAQIRLQDEIAPLLMKKRYEKGALFLQTREFQPIIRHQEVVSYTSNIKNRARDLIENFMIAANAATAHHLDAYQFPSLRRVVKTPRRWDRIVEIAQSLGEQLPEEPDSKALNHFLINQQTIDPTHFSELSLTMIKLLGRGEYIVEYPGQPPVGHFNLALKDYTHFTAPNRRFPDLITQRLIKSTWNNEKAFYSPSELEYLAQHCTQKEKDAEKVERKMRKSAICLVLISQINRTYDALVTGAGPKGVWVRISDPIVEGKLIQGMPNLDVGDRIRVRLVNVNVMKGFIDFVQEMK